MKPPSCMRREYGTPPRWRRRRWIGWTGRTQRSVSGANPVRVAGAQRALQGLTGETVRVHRLPAAICRMVQAIGVTKLVGRDVGQVIARRRLDAAVAFRAGDEPRQPSVEDGVALD